MRLFQALISNPPKARFPQDAESPPKYRWEGVREAGAQTVFIIRPIACPDSPCLGLGVKQSTRDDQTLLACTHRSSTHRSHGAYHCSTLSGIPMTEKFFRLWQEKGTGPKLFSFSRRKAKPASSFLYMRSAPAQHREGPHTNQCFRTRALESSSTETSNALKVIQMKRC